MDKILIVDDEPSVREMIRDMIKPLGYEIAEAGNGAEAQVLCNAGSVCLIISDLVMPEINGIDLIMEVNKTFPHIPVIAISGGGGIDGRFDYLEIARLVGAKAVLKKPFSMEDLRSAIVSELGSQ